MAFRLSRFPSVVAIVDAMGRPLQVMQKWMQSFAEATEFSALASSFPTGLTITAADVGSDATATISDHTRRYGDGTSASVTGGTVTGLTFATDYLIYYDDPARNGGTVTYAATQLQADAAQLGNRHTIGHILTPANGAGNTTGVPVLPPGVGALVPPF